MKKIKIIAICALCLLIGGGIYLYTTAYREVTLSQAQIKEYDKYKPFITEDTTKADILELCEEVETLTIGEHVLTIYESEELETYLSECKEMVEISGDENHLYIGYKTTEDKTAVLCYTDVGFRELAMHDDKKDDSVFITTEGGTLTRNRSKLRVEGLEY